MARPVASPFVHSCTDPCTTSPHIPPYRFCSLALPIMTPTGRVVVRDAFPQVRGGRSRSSAARAFRLIRGGFQWPGRLGARKRNLTPFGASGYTPHASGCGVQVNRAPGMQFFAQTPSNTAPSLLGERMSIGIRLYLFEIPSLRTSRMTIDIRWKQHPSSMYADRHSPPGLQGTPCLAVSRPGFHRFTARTMYMEDEK